MCIGDFMEKYVARAEIDFECLTRIFKKMKRLSSNIYELHIYGGGYVLYIQSPSKDYLSVYTVFQPQATGFKLDEAFAVSLPLELVRWISATLIRDAKAIKNAYISKTSFAVGDEMFELEPALVEVDLSKGLTSLRRASVAGGTTWDSSRLLQAADACPSAFKSACLSQDLHVFFNEDKSRANYLYTPSEKAQEGMYFSDSLSSLLDTLEAYKVPSVEVCVTDLWEGMWIRKQMLRVDGAEGKIDVELEVFLHGDSAKSAQVLQLCRESRSIEDIEWKGFTFDVLIGKLEQASKLPDSEEDINSSLVKVLVPGYKLPKLEFGYIKTWATKAKALYLKHSLTEEDLSFSMGVWQGQGLLILNLGIHSYVSTLYKEV
jgi:hypothetical protein